jgi:catechol 2,3-dioxygenase-like lactoylglutathione lyase family enzyme
LAGDAVILVRDGLGAHRRRQVTYWLAGQPAGYTPSDYPAAPATPTPSCVCGIPDSRTEIVMLKPPDLGTRLELSSFVRPDSVPGSPDAMANELGLRNVAFEVNDLHAAVDWAATEGYGLVGGIGEYEGAWRMAYVRGPEGIIVSLAERIG